MSSTYTEYPRDVARKPTTFSTYGNFVEGFLNGLSQSLDSDLAANMNPAKRLCKVKERGADVSPTAKACAHRFALGVDDAMYLNAGVSLLCVAGTETRDLAPPNLYAADTLEATKNALIALASDESERRRKQAPGLLNNILKQIRSLTVGVKEIGNMITSTDARELLASGDFKDTPEKRKAMQSLVKELTNVVVDTKNDDLVYSFTKYVEQAQEQERNRSAEINLALSEAQNKHEREVQQLTMENEYAEMNHVVEVQELTERLERANQNIQRLTEDLDFFKEDFEDVGEVPTEVPAFIRTAQNIRERQPTSVLMTPGQVDTVAPRIDTHPLFLQEAAEALVSSGSFQKAINSQDLALESAEILRRTASVIKLRRLDRLVTGVGVDGAAQTDPTFTADTGTQTDMEERTLTDAIGVFLDTARAYLDAFSTKEELMKAAEDLLPSGKAEERRAGIWNEMLKDAALATDRLWIFVRTLSGLIGEDAESILESADDDTIRASKEADKRRNEIAETVSKFQAKLIETLVGGLVKESKLQLTTPKDASDQLVVVDSETAKQIRDLASGESGRPFFEANVALRNLQESSKGQPRRLSDLIGEFGEVSKALHESLVKELKVGEGVAGSTLSNLSKPANSYFVKLRDDTSAAIRAAYDRFLVEYELKVGGRRVKLWELIEGADNLLSTRFAELCGHVLVQNRLSTGVSAMYVSRNQTTVNAAQAHVSLARLINQAASYASRVPAADWKGNDVVGQRNRYFENARDKVDTWASGAGGAYGPARSQFVPSWQTTYAGMVRGLQY